MEMSAQFLLTIDDAPDRSKNAVQLVREMGERNLLDALPDPDRVTQSVYLPLNKVLLMIGTTSELEKACNEAYRGGAGFITSDDEKTAQTRWYVRVKAGLTRTDTLIALATARYWGASAPVDKWDELPGRASYYCSLLDGGAVGRKLSETTNLLDMIRDCKGVNGWVKA
jgi:hypothetical protein